MKSQTIASLIFLSLLSLVSYGQEADTTVRIEFGFEDHNGLIQKFKELGYDALHGDECCDSQPYEEALSIWIGRKVPFEDVKKIVEGALNNYPQLSYYRYFGNKGNDYPNKRDHTIFIGGSKWAAHKVVKMVPSEDAKVLFEKIESKAELSELLSTFEL